MQLIQFNSSFQIASYIALISNNLTYQFEMRHTLLIRHDKIIKASTAHNSKRSTKHGIARYRLNHEDFFDKPIT